MKRSMINVDYEWALNEVLCSNDLSDKSPAWVKSFVEGWRNGFLEGYLMGYMETIVKLIFDMKRKGISSDIIEEITGVSKDVIKMVRSDVAATD